MKKVFDKIIKNAGTSRPVLTFEETNSVNTFIITPIRTEKDMKA